MNQLNLFHVREPKPEKARLLARTNGPQTSKDAAKKIVSTGELSRQEKRVYNAIIHYHRNDKFTTKDAAYWLAFERGYSFDKAYLICARRFSGLRNKGKIERISINNTGKPPWKKRDDCCVWGLL